MVAETLRKLYKDQIFYALRLENEEREARVNDPLRKTKLQEYTDFLVEVGEIDKTEAAELVIWLCEKDRTHECLYYADELSRDFKDTINKPPVIPEKKSTEAKRKKISKENIALIAAYISLALSASALILAIVRLLTRTLS